VSIKTSELDSIAGSRCDLTEIDGDMSEAVSESGESLTMMGLSRLPSKREAKIRGAVVNPGRMGAAIKGAGRAWLTWRIAVRNFLERRCMLQERVGGQ